MSDREQQKRLDEIRDKVEQGQRLSAADGLLLYDESVDLHVVGELANLVRRRINEHRTYYNLNAHINPTNVCIYRCRLCAYSRDLDDPRAYTLSDDQLIARGHEAADAGCTELHIVGGVHPEKKFEWYRGILSLLHVAFPRLLLKAWTAVEIDAFSRNSGRPVRAILEELIGAGLCCLPGGGAEIFDPAVRSEICPRKADAATWLDVHRTAHQLGLPSTATMLFGHLENAEQRIDHLVQLRQLQDETGGFRAFVPLSFHPKNTHLEHLPKPSPLLELRTIAVSRLMLDNFDHVKAYWISLGLGTAQVALGYGADDLDGTVRKELIHHDAGAASPQEVTVDRLCELIREAGCEPIERDTLYRRVIRDGYAWQIEEPGA